MKEIYNILTKYNRTIKAYNPIWSLRQMSTKLQSVSEAANLVYRLSFFHSGH